jgi:hypothetical protein
MSVEITGPIKLMMAVLVGLVCCVLAVVALAGTGMGGATVSTALISTNTNLTNSLPYIGVLVATGFVMAAMKGR